LCIVEALQGCLCSPPPNGDYPTIFLRGWLAHSKGHKVNWSLYAHDCIVQQMKNTTRPPLASISNCSLPSSKSITLLANSNYNQSNVAIEDDSLIFLGEKTYIIIFLPNQVAIMKRLLQEA